MQFVEQATGVAGTKRRRSVGLLLAALSVILGGAALIPARATRPEATVQIGMIESLFRGSDTAVMLAQTQPFSELLYSQTGVRGQFTIIPDAHEMAKQLREEKLQLGIMHGIEYAWIKGEYPELQPLLLAYNQTIKLKGYLLVHRDSPLQTVGDLKGKTLAFPKRSLNHCYLFLHKAIGDAGHNPAGFFAPTACPANIDAALDAVVDGTADAVVVDGVSYEVFKSRKPGRAAKLRVLKESGLFPTATIVYKPSAANEEMVRKFRDGLTTAHERVLGRQMLTLWRLSNFGHVPQEYSQLLNDVLKEYPEPMHPAAFFPEPPKTGVGN
jgi:ABC-type phosphate/phosphonate transport system substrate-binding protein